MSIQEDDLERRACVPVSLKQGEFNSAALIPYGCTVDHIHQAMADFLDFLAFLNVQLHSRGLSRLETMLMPANFSSIVGEFMHQAISKYCTTLVKNRHHNGHPDLLPAGRYPGDAVLHGIDGIEIKASRYRSGWQGHNAEAIWLLIFVFESDSQAEQGAGHIPRPFRFVSVGGAQLTREDWSEAGRAPTSRRTPTASVRRSGRDKIMQNWIYRTSGGT